MNSLSQKLSLLIPMLNEEATIASTLRELVNKGLDKRYKIIVCDDDSTDRSVVEARQVAREYSNISVVINRPNGKKIGAFKTGLQSVTTPYVLLLDADSMILELDKGALDLLVDKMQTYNISAMGFKVRPFAYNCLENFQALEFMLATDGLRKVLGVVVVLAGLGSIWSVDSLTNVLSEHSGEFEGDDLESTMLATILGYKISYEAHTVIITTKLKKTLRELTIQRARIWDFGLARTFVDTPKILRQIGREGAFFRSVLVTEVLTHPFKVFSMIGLCLIMLLMLLTEFDVRSITPFLPRIHDGVWQVLRSTFWLYFLIWLLNTISIILTIRSFWYGAAFIIYFTYYMATPFIPLLSTNFAQALGITYLWWYAPCVLLILTCTDSWETKARSLIWGMLLPFYFFYLLAVPRTIGFTIYVLGIYRSQFIRKSSGNL